MSFIVEQTEYSKTILSDLQGTWTLLRDTVVDTGGFENADRVLFHIDEAMSWEVVRDLTQMPPLLLIITNMCRTGNAPDEVMECVTAVKEILLEVMEEYPR
jgi:hypothetical protein